MKKSARKNKNDEKQKNDKKQGTDKLVNQISEYLKENYDLYKDKLILYLMQKLLLLLIWSYSLLVLLLLLLLPLFGGEKLQKPPRPQYG